MTKKIINQTSFTSGELSPELQSRVDTAEYAKGLETATNVEIDAHGAIRRRNGGKFIAEVKDSSTAVRLVRYQFSLDVAFILEFGNQYIRFFTNGGQVLEANDTITGITQANPGVVTTSSAHGYSNGDHVYITSVAGMTEVNSSTVPYEVANVTSTTFELNDVDGNNIDTTGYTAYSSGGVSNRIYEITSPWTTAQVADIQYAQDGSNMYIVHPDVAPRTLKRNSDTDWDIETLTLLPPPTYESGYENTGVSVTPAATSGLGVNFTASSGIFLDGDIGRQIINNSDGETGRASIVSITSTTVAVCDIVEDFTDTNAIASADWKMDLSPVVDLEFDATQAGAIVNIRSEYTSGSLGDRFTITGVTKANPAVVTTSASHGFANGDQVQIQDIVGMTQINNKLFTVEGVTSTTFQLKGEDSTGYTTYSSGGIVRQVLTDIAKDAFRSADVDKYIVANGGVMQIIAVNSADDVDAEILKSLNSADITGNWTLETDAWDGTRGYPRSVGIYDQRLWFAGTAAQPLTVWSSETGIFDGFGVGPDDEDAIEVNLDTNEANAISWLQGGRDLVIGTEGEELTLSGSSTNATITSASIAARPRTASGSPRQQVPKVADELIFYDITTKNLIAFRYDFNIDGYTDEHVLFLGEHLVQSGISKVTWAKVPDRTLYVVNGDEELIVGIYDRAKRIIGWTRWNTDGYYEDVEKVKTSSEDQVWTVVRRTINGGTKRYIELMDSGTGEDDIDGYSDCYLTASTPIAISGITAANPAVVTTSAAHGLSNGDLVIIKDLVDPLPADLDSSKTNMSDLNNGTYTVANKTSTTFELTSTNTSNYNAYGSSGNCWLKVTSISGLDHLEGKTVQIKVDGSTHANKTVSSGAITLDNAAGEIVIGLPYTSTIKTLSSEYDIGLGSMQGQRTRWSRPLIRVYKSARPLVNNEFLPARSGADKMGQKSPLYTGFLEYGPLSWNNTSAITVTISDPLPLTITGITGVIDAGIK